MRKAERKKIDAFEMWCFGSQVMRLSWMEKKYRIVIIFTRVHWGEGGQWLPYAYLNVDYDAMYFHTRLLKINIFKVLFWEGVTKKRVLYVHF